MYEYDYTTSTVPEENKFRYKDTYTYGDYGSMHKNCLHLVYRSTDMESLGNVVDGWEMVESYTRHTFQNGNIGVFDHGRLTSYGDFQMEYDINGIRQSKTHTVTDGDIYTTGSQTDTVTTHTYYTENNVIHKEVVEVKKIEKGFEDRIYPDGSVLEDYFERETILSTKTFTYFYDESGICGLNYNEKNYYFQKNAFGDVVRIYGPDALLVAEYVYDAWGNHKIFDKDGLEITNSDHVANLNPFRYRGYYYDTDMQLYYLNSRYYSPRACRFVSADNMDIALYEYKTGI